MDRKVLIDRRQPTSLGRARRIMAENMIQLPQAEEWFSFRYTPQQRRMLNSVSFSTAKLMECQQTHILFPGYPINLVQARYRLPLDRFPQCNVWCWYDIHPFAKTKVRVRWYLMRKTPVPDSTSLMYHRQVELLAPDEDVPFACAAFYGAMLYYFKTGRLILRRVGVRCRDIDWDVGRIHIVTGRPYGLYAGNHMDIWSDPSIGLAAEILPYSRKRKKAA